jgi:hypothetical protein
MERRRFKQYFLEYFDRLVVMYVESSRADPRGPRSLAQVVAVSVSTGAALERFLVPPFGLPSAVHLDHMGLHPQDFAGAVNLAQFRRDVGEFLDSQPGALIAAWNQTSLDLLAHALGQPPSRLSLKSAYRSVKGGGSGSLDEVTAREGLDPTPLGLRGRAGIRLARAVAIARLLNRLATTPRPRPP